MEIKDFKVGQKVWVRLTGNASRGKNGNDLIEEWEVVSVGRKYVKAKKVGYSHSWEIEFEKRGYSERFVQKTNTCVDYVIYESKQAILDELEASNLERKIYDFFKNYGNKNISLEQLREISKIIWGENNGLE